MSQYRQSQHYNARKAARARYKPDLNRYEIERQKWLDAHPDAPREEYQRAMRAISALCGI